jgi:hypothetical protein
VLREPPPVDRCRAGAALTFEGLREAGPTGQKSPSGDVAAWSPVHRFGIRGISVSLPIFDINAASSENISSDTIAQRARHIRP